MSVLDKVDEVQRIALQENDVLVVRVNCDGLSRTIGEKYMQDIKDIVSLYFLTNKILVIPTDISFSVITPTEENTNDQV